MIEAAKLGVFIASIYDNKYLTDKVRDNYIKMFTGTADENARLKGMAVRKSGLLYPMFDKGIHVIKDNLEYLEKGFPVIRAIDPHPQVPIHVQWLAINPNGEAGIVKELICPENATIQRCATMIKAIESNMNVIYGIIDPSANTKQQQADGGEGRTTKQLFSEEDVYCRDAKKDFDSGYHIVVKALQGVEVPSRTEEGKIDIYHKFHVHASCVETIYEFTHCVWEAPSNDKKDGPQRQVKKRDHMIDLTRYLLKEFPSFEVETNAPKSFFGGPGGWRN